MKQLPTGARAPDFELQGLSGRTFRLVKAVESSPVVLAFYKSACPTCQFTFPYLQRIHAEIGISSPVKIYGISQDEVNPTRGFVERFGIGFDVLIDEHPFAISAAYSLEYVPGLFIVSPDMTIRLSDYGFSKAALSEIAAVVAEYTSLVPPLLFPANDGVPASRPG